VAAVVVCMPSYGTVEPVSAAGEVVVGLAIAVGLVGVVVPVLPGALLVWAAIVAWALWTQTWTAWVVLAVATVAVLAAQVVKYVIPDRRLRASGVPRRSVVVGGLLALVGFFVVPVVGLVLGFVGGVYAAERRRLGHHEPAWRATTVAVRAVGVGLLVELAGALLAAVAWSAGAVAT
jgi:uncharacterized protein